ncbi:hypothetical protein MH215_10365 [Paenibacillus sp. ACRSA]|uniref:hypothetical protein n=1 Tax=Paenibacillus sp. ACRSA TaxID=2918211 RepID=UPI001EF4B75E|nr:hypothetical protein [Paenibacillus sp. ACRSA]MCG7377399.1 hypothetical protein [Paenibacillus sp. ACRSA]
MSDVWSFFVALVISLPITGATMLAALKFWGKAYINQQFNKKLEDHKHDLSAIMEVSKFDLQRKSYDFNLYTTKRHESYVDLHNSLLGTQGCISNFNRGLERSPHFAFVQYEDLKHFLESNNLRPDRIEYFLGLWTKIPSSDNPLNKELREHFKQQELKRLNDSLVNSLNKSLLVSLYLSEEVTRSTEAIIIEMHKAYDFIEQFCLSHSPEDVKYIEFGNAMEISKEISSSIKSLRLQMKKELSVGYYDQM